MQIGKGFPSRNPTEEEKVLSVISMLSVNCSMFVTVSLLILLSPTVQTLIYKNDYVLPAPESIVVPDPTGFGGKEL